MKKVYLTLCLAVITMGSLIAGPVSQQKAQQIGAKFLSTTALGQRNTDIQLTLVSVVTDNARMFMPMADLVDFEKERERIRKELANAEKQLAAISGKLKNENFVSKAPEAVVNAEREKAEKLKALIQKLDASAAAMKK